MQVSRWDQRKVKCHATKGLVAVWSTTGWVPGQTLLVPTLSSEKNTERDGPSGALKTTQAHCGREESCAESTGRALLKAGGLGEQGALCCAHCLPDNTGGSL